MPKVFGNQLFPITIIRIRRQRFSLEMEFSRDLSDRDVENLRKVEIEKHRLSVHGLFGNKHYSCPCCGSKNHLPRECPVASTKHVVMHYDYFLSSKDLRFIQRRTGCHDICLGTPVSKPKRPYMNHVTVSYKSEASLLKCKDKLQAYAHDAQIGYSDLWTQPQWVNCCEECGQNRASDFCECGSVKSAGPIMSAEEFIQGPKAGPGMPSEWNPWARQDHAEFIKIQKERDIDPPEDVKFEDTENELESLQTGAISKSANSALSRPSAGNHSSNVSKPFIEELTDKGLKIFNIPEKLLKPVKKALETSKSGWRSTGNSRYSEKILGPTNMFKEKMGISYDKNQKFRPAVKWSLQFEALAREASVITSAGSVDKTSINLFICNRYDSVDQEGGLHADLEPQCHPKSSVIIPIGPRIFHLQNKKDTSAPGFKSTTITLDSGQMLLIPPNLNEGPDQIFHRKGKGLAGQHFTLVGKSYVGSQKSQ